MRTVHEMQAYPRLEDVGVLVDAVKSLAEHVNGAALALRLHDTPEARRILDTALERALAIYPPGGKP